MVEVDLQVERSIALHAAVAAKLRDHPELIERAAAKVEVWLARGGRSSALLTRWRDVLGRAPEDIASFLTDRSEEAAWLRKASPFAGALSPQERWRVLREVKARREPLVGR
jgi:hypothetical protein